MNNPAMIIEAQDGALRRALRRLVPRQGFEVVESSGMGELIRSLQNGIPDFIIIGSSQKGAADGLKAVREVRRHDPKIPIIFVTSSNSEDLAIEALRIGANDYLKMPVVWEDLAAIIKRSLSGLHVKSGAIPEPTMAEPCSEDRIITRNPAMEGMINFIKQVATANSNVLITGETGTGKELVACMIHRYSSRAKNPFVVINCAAIPETLLESELFGYEKGAFTGAHARREGALRLADSGTVFLDEIGDMSSHAQAKVLRMMEHKEVCRVGGINAIPVNVRFIAATNQNLEQLMKEDKFRPDLYFRLNVARIYIPPLRERKEDIVLLMEYFRKKLNRQFGKKVKGFTPEAVEALVDYDWPGNIRELKNRLEAAFISADATVGLKDFPEFFRRQLQENKGKPQDERSRLLSALFNTSWNKTKAAQQLQWSRMTLYRKMVKYGILAISGEDGQRKLTTLETDPPLN
jgi:DNA-binding NtrC family response regulator